MHKRKSRSVAVAGKGIFPAWFRGLFVAILAALAALPVRADFASSVARAQGLRSSAHYLAAVAEYRRAIPLGNQERGPRDPTVLAIRLELAETIAQADLLGEAHRQYESNLVDIRAALGATHEMAAYAQARLGLSWYRMGNFPKALENLREAHQLLEKAPGGYAEFLPVLASWVGHVLADQGRGEEAAQWRARATRLLEALPARDAAARLRHKHLFIELQSRVYVTPELLRMREELLGEVRKLRGERHLDTLDGLLQLAGMQFAAGNWEAAWRSNETGLSLASDLLGENHEVVHGIRYNQGLVEMRLGHLPRARELLHAAAVARERKLGARHNESLMALAQLARVCNQQGDYKTAAKLGGELIARIESLRELRHLPPESQRHYFARWASAYKIQAHSLVQLKDFAQAFRVMELARARGLRETASLYDALESKLLLPAEKAAWEEARLKLVASEAEVVSAKFGSDERLRLEKTRDTLSSGFSQLRARAEAREPRLQALSQINVPDWNTLAGKLGAGVVYVSFALDEDVLLVFGVSRERGSAVTLPKPGVGLLETIYAYRALLQTRGGLRALEQAGHSVVRDSENGYRVVKRDQIGDRPRADADEIGAWLGKTLLSEILARFPEAKRLAISPDHLLALIPFETLRWNGRYLIEQMEVLYTPSAELLLKTARRMQDYRRLERPKDLLAVGGAIYTELVPYSPLISVHHTLLDLTAPPPGLEQEAAPVLGGATTVKQAMSGFRAKWQNLPYTTEEIENIASQFERGRSTVMTYSQASEAHLRELDSRGRLGDYRYLLFSTHGYLNLREPTLTAIVLSQVGADDRWDGFLTVGELQLYKLKSDLVFVSACESGLGRVVNGDGIAGLPYALFLAGNVNSVVTLWPILDRPSGEFSKQFFEKLREGKDQVTALAEVKRNFLKDDSLRDPLYWAGFVLYGV